MFFGVAILFSPELFYCSRFVLPYLVVCLLLHSSASLNGYDLRIASLIPTLSPDDNTTKQTNTYHNTYRLQSVYQELGNSILIKHSSPGTVTKKQDKKKQPASFTPPTPEHHQHTTTKHHPAQRHIGSSYFHKPDSSRPCRRLKSCDVSAIGPPLSNHTSTSSPQSLPPANIRQLLRTTDTYSIAARNGNCLPKNSAAPRRP